MHFKHEHIILKFIPSLSCPKGKDNRESAIECHLNKCTWKPAIEVDQIVFKPSPPPQCQRKKTKGLKFGNHYLGKLWEVADNFDYVQNNLCYNRGRSSGNVEQHSYSNQKVS